MTRNWIKGDDACRAWMQDVGLCDQNGNSTPDWLHVWNGLNNPPTTPPVYKALSNDDLALLNWMINRVVDQYRTLPDKSQMDEVMLRVMMNSAKNYIDERIHEGRSEQMSPLNPDQRQVATPDQATRVAEGGPQYRFTPSHPTPQEVTWIQAFGAFIVDRASEEDKAAVNRAVEDGLANLYTEGLTSCGGGLDMSLPNTYVSR